MLFRHVVPPNNRQRGIYPTLCGQVHSQIRAEPHAFGAWQGASFKFAPGDDVGRVDG